MFRRSAACVWRATRARLFSTQPAAADSGSRPLRFSLELPSTNSHQSRDLLSTLRSWDGLVNPNGHDAAVVLATPDHARRIVDDEFMADLASTLAGPESRGQFHMLGAAVDHVAPPVGSYQPFRGLSILRGKLDQLLPQLWQDSPPRSKEDAKAPAALLLQMGRTTVTVPGANTAFHNARDFTMVASHYDFSKPGHNVLRRLEKTQQQVITPVSRQVDTLADLGIWAPVLPVTQPRAVTASFGNIVKGVEVTSEDGPRTVPASEELEAAVEKAFQHKPDLAENGPIGIWALVTPKDLHDEAGMQAMLDSSMDSEELIEATARHIEQLYSQGARLYQILSGGGGWGAKKGLLSLDPQQSHFALSEEESLRRFMGSMEESEFAPQGSYIQFFTPLRARSDGHEESSQAQGSIFGVADPSLQSRDAGEPRIHPGLFGALSDSGIFIADPSGAESKLSVPNSRVYSLNEDDGRRLWAQQHSSDHGLMLMPTWFPGEGGAAGAEAAGEAGSGGLLDGVDLF